MKKEDQPKPDEVRPPIEKGGMSFDEILKRLSQTKPEEVKEAEKAENEESGNGNLSK